jgi:hypothetical protein
MWRTEIDEQLIDITNRLAGHREWWGNTSEGRMMIYLALINIAITTLDAKEQGAYQGRYPRDPGV